jgi:hypothetical protein
MGMIVSIRRLWRTSIAIFLVVLLLFFYFKIAIFHSAIYFISLILTIILVVFIVVWRRGAKYFEMRLRFTSHKTFLVTVLLSLYITVAILPLILLGREPYPGYLLIRLLFLLLILVVCTIAWNKSRERKC